ncbi:MAG: phosphatidylserine decarboxylase [Erythrobacter sp.]|nr:MAG: phosphatidylserine decarboxylase [Erythrobacter sp.]
MSLRSVAHRLLAQEELNFLLTNRIPRHALTRFMGWFARRENPLLRVPSIALWRFFCDVDLTDAQTREFRSLHHAFTRALVPGARVFDADPAVFAAPCDAIVGAFGTVHGGQAFQVKGMDYALADLLGDVEEASAFEGGQFITLRLTAGMYHRFHAPQDMVVEQVRYISGDTWNVNPVALKRVERLYCRNERAPILARLADGEARVALVPVAAILVASIRLPFVDAAEPVRSLHQRIWREQVRFAKGEEMGWFEHGSTIVALLPPGLRPVEGLASGARIKAGEAMLVAG